MAFMVKKKRYKFNVRCCLEELTEVPFVSAVLFAKVRLLDGRTFQDQSSREEVRNHAVRWNANFEFVCKMCANASTGVLEPALLRISVRKECKGGRSYQKLGFCDVNLAEAAGAGETTRRCLLEGYDPRRRQDNSVLRLRIRMDMVVGDPLFKVPSPSLKHRIAVSEAATEGTDSGAETGGGAPGAGAGEGDDCASSVASAGSSGFGSLTKKRTNANELNSGGGTALSSLPSCELPGETNEQAPSTDTPDGAGGVGGGTGGGAGCAACGGPAAHTHSRNSSNTSGDMSSKASGYGSSLSQQSQHSRQSSEGGESAPEPVRPGHISQKRPLASVPPSFHLVPRTGVTTGGVASVQRFTKLILEKSKSQTSDSSDLYLTPNCTIGDCPDVVPRPRPSWPLSPQSPEYRTPDSTRTTREHSFSMPSYFDKKKRDAASMISAAVKPLTNFQIFKQKSLNTIPDFIEKRKKNEEGLFNNFPFLTPLANRKSSLISDQRRLSGCLEDDFYCIPSDSEANGSGERIDVRSRLKSLSNHALEPCSSADEEVFTSTPKETRPTRGLFVKNSAQRRQFMSERSRAPEARSVQPLRHSYTNRGVRGDCVVCGTWLGGAGAGDAGGEVIAHRRPSSTLNPSSGSLTASASETGSLDRARPSHDRRKHKSASTLTGVPAQNPADPEHGTGRVENTRVNPDELIDELIKETNLEQAVEDNAETSGLQLFIARDGTAAVGTRQVKQQLAAHNYKRVVVHADDR